MNITTENTTIEIKPTLDFALLPTELDAIRFSITSMVSWNVTKAALAAVRELPLEVEDPTIDTFNDFMAELDAAAASTDFFSKTGQAPRASNKERLEAWLGFADINKLQLDTINNLKFLMSSTENNRYSNEEIEQLAKATTVAEGTVFRANETEVKENQEALRKQSIDTINLLSTCNLTFETEAIETELKETILNACRSSRKGIGKRRGSFADKMADLTIIKTIEDRF